MITKEQVADLQPGDVVRTTGWYGLTVEGPLSPSIDGSLWLGQHQLIRDADGEVGHWAKGGSTLTVVSRAPRPLYVNHPRTEPLMNDVARDPAEGYTSRIWIFDGFDWWFPNGDTVVMVTTDDMPKPMRLLVDGETGRCVP